MFNSRFLSALATLYNHLYHLIPDHFITPFKKRPMFNIVIHLSPPPHPHVSKF